MISRMSDRRPIKILKVHYQDEADLKRRIWLAKMNSRVDYTKCQVSKIEDYGEIGFFPYQKPFLYRSAKHVMKDLRFITFLLETLLEHLPS